MLLMLFSCLVHGQIAWDVQNAYPDSDALDSFELHGAVRSMELPLDNGYVQRIYWHFTESGQLDVTETTLGDESITRTIKTNYSYNNHGKVILQSTASDVDNITVRYNYRGDTLLGYWHNQEGLSPLRMIAVYDDSERLIEIRPSRFRFLQGSNATIIRYEYQDDYLVSIHNSTLSHENAVLHDLVYHYDATGRAIGQDVVSESDVQQLRFQYDEDKVVAYSQITLRGDRVVEEETFVLVDEVLDAQGNWIERQWQSQQSEEIETVTRKISYYEGN